MSEFSYSHGDDFWNILRKFLGVLNANTAAPVTAATTPAQGDTSWSLMRKSLARLIELETSGASYAFQTGDSMWALVRKLLGVVNLLSGGGATSTVFVQGDSLEVLSRKILFRLCEISSASLPDGVEFAPGDNLNTLWRKILSVTDVASGTWFSVATPSDLHIAMLDFAGKIKVLWADESTNETGFEVWTSTDGVNYVLADTRAANVTYSVLEGLLNQNYWVKVRAVSVATDSAFTAPVQINPFTGGTPDLTAHYVDYNINTVDVTVDNIVDPPGDVVVYESDNNDLSDPVVVDTITLPPNSGGRTHTISNHGVAVTRRNVFARQRNAALQESGDSPAVTKIDPQYGELMATDWASRVVANGGAQPSAGTIAALETFGSALVAAGIHSKMLAVNFVAPDSKIAARTPYIHTIGTDPWLPDTGAPNPDTFFDLTVNGVDVNGPGGGYSWMPGINPFNDMTQNNCGMTIYAYNAAPMNDFTIACSTTTYFGLWVNYANTASASAIGGFADSTYAGVSWTPLNGYYSANRTSATSNVLYFANSTTAHVAKATAVGNNANALPNTPIHVVSTTGGGSWADFVFSFVAFHKGLSSAESAALYSAVQALRTSLGGGYR